MDLLKKYGVTERFVNEAAMYENLALARVIAQHRDFYRVVTSEGEFLAKISGRLRHETDELAKFPAVGDCVMVSGDAVIQHILTRKTVLLRTAVGVSGQAQVIAANVDILFVCMSLNNNYNLNRLERYLSVAWDSGASPVVVLTKSDLCRDLRAVTDEIRRVAAFADVITTSAFEDDVETKLNKYIKEGVTGAFIGSSGVGKSTLINKLLGENRLDTKETGKTDKGRHTTTGREMFPCPSGGTIIDTPGMRELGAEGADLSKTFADIDSFSANCKFRDCTHTNEPGCALRAAADEGAVDERRLENYLKLKREAGYDGLNSKEIETKKFERMFKEVGGMKNARKILKDNNKRK